MVLKELILNSFSCWEGVVVLDRTDFFNSFYCWEGVVVLTELICKSSIIWAGCGGLARYLIFSAVSTIGRVWWS